MHIISERYGCVTQLNRTTYFQDKNFNKNIHRSVCVPVWVVGCSLNSIKQCSVQLCTLVAGDTSAIECTPAEGSQLNKDRHHCSVLPVNTRGCFINISRGAFSVRWFAASGEVGTSETVTFIRIRHTCSC